MEKLEGLVDRSGIAERRGKRRCYRVVGAEIDDGQQAQFTDACLAFALVGIGEQEAELRLSAARIMAPHRAAPARDAHRRTCGTGGYPLLPVGSSSRLVPANETPAPRRESSPPRRLLHARSCRASEEASSSICVFFGRPRGAIGTGSRCGPRAAERISIHCWISSSRQATELGPRRTRCGN